MGLGASGWTAYLPPEASGPGCRAGSRPRFQRTGGDRPARRSSGSRAVLASVDSIRTRELPSSGPACSPSRSRSGTSPTGRGSRDRLPRHPNEMTAEAGRRVSPRNDSFARSCGSLLRRGPCFPSPKLDALGEEERKRTPSVQPGERLLHCAMMRTRGLVERRPLPGSGTGTVTQLRTACLAVDRLLRIQNPSRLGNHLQRIGGSPALSLSEDRT